MIKSLSLPTAAPELSHDEFVAALLMEIHAPLAHAVPASYATSRTISRRAPRATIPPPKCVDGLAELWYDDRAADGPRQCVARSQRLHDDGALSRRIIELHHRRKKVIIPISQ